MTSIKTGNYYKFNLYIEKDSDYSDIEIYPNIAVYCGKKTLFGFNNEGVVKVKNGHYSYEFYADPKYDLGNNYKIEWQFSINGKAKEVSKRIERFEIIDLDDPKFYVYEENPYGFLMENVRSLVLDNSTPIKSFSINANANAYIKIKSNSLDIYIEDKIEQFEFKYYPTIIDLLNAIEDKFSGFEIKIDVECDDKKSPFELKRTLKVFVGSEEIFYFSHFFSDNELKVIIDSCISTYNRDFYREYTLQDFETKDLDLLQYLIASKALLARSAKDAKSLSDLMQEDRIDRVILANKIDLQFQSPDGLAKNQSIANPMDSWRALSKAYYNLYDEARKRVLPPFQTTDIVKVSRRTGRKSFLKDSGIKQDIELYRDTTIKDKSICRLYWDSIITEDFAMYKLFSSQNIDDLKQERIGNSTLEYSTYDNHNTVFNAKLKDGLTYFIVGVYNKNNIVKFSNIIGVEYYSG